MSAGSEIVRASDQTPFITKPNAGIISEMNWYGNTEPQSRRLGIGDRMQTLNPMPDTVQLPNPQPRSPRLPALLHAGFILNGMVNMTLGTFPLAFSVG